MKIPVILFMSLAMLSVSLVFAADQDDTMVIVIMPKGDPAAGRKAFLDLGCNSCHAVTHDASLPTPNEKDRGPDLGGKESDWPVGYQATSIISPSHLVSYQYINKTKNFESPMPDLTEKMTVKQLINLLAYLRPSKKSP